MARTDIHPYLSEGIIAYIGNKRRLLGLIGDAIARVTGRREGGTFERNMEGLHFADLFAGSGIVSRYARFRGMEVFSNDWEPYAATLSRAWIEAQPEDIDRLFGSPDGLERSILELNQLKEPLEEERYLSHYYAPSSDNPDEADYRRERLFYTRQNALKLDAARNHLNTISPPPHLSKTELELRHSLLLTPLLYAAATNVNTSGVFKAYHRGFGGHGKDALSRIMAPIQFKAPLILDAPRGKTFSMDAAELAGSSLIDNADIVYLDPPYNQHQYGSNYHMLNTIVRWDKIPEPLDLGSDGRLLRKAGIRPDWRETRSPYCSRKGAEAAFEDLLDRLKAPLLLVSYSTDGIIPFESLRRLCEKYGRLTLMANPYVTYRGGRQSVHRRDGNLEFVMIVEKGRTTAPVDRKDLDDVLLRRRLQLALNDLYRPEFLKRSGRQDGKDWKVRLPGTLLSLPSRYLVCLEGSEQLDKLSTEDAKALILVLDEARCQSRVEELEILESVWEANPGECRDILKLIPRLLRKMAHLKYRNEYEAHLQVLKNLGERFPEDYSVLSRSLEKIEDVASRRFAG